MVLPEGDCRATLTVGLAPDVSPITADGRTTWYDLQTPKSEVFWLAGVGVVASQATRHAVARAHWWVHLSVSPGGTAWRDGLRYLTCAASAGTTLTSSSATTAPKAALPAGDRCVLSGVPSAFAASNSSAATGPMRSSSSMLLA